MSVTPTLAWIARSYGGCRFILGVAESERASDEQIAEKDPSDLYVWRRSEHQHLGAHGYQAK